MKHDPIMNASGQTIGKAAEEVREKLHRALSIMETIPVESAPATSSLTSASVTENEVRAILRARRQRARVFDGDLFADPAWDILLELYAAELGQRRVSVSTLCIGAAVPATTALRWIGTLESRRMITRTNDPFDGRRVYVSLTPPASSSLGKYFANLGPSERPI